MFHSVNVVGRVLSFQEWPNKVSLEILSEQQPRKLHCMVTGYGEQDCEGRPLLREGLNVTVLNAHLEPTSSGYAAIRNVGQADAFTVHDLACFYGNIHYLAEGEAEHGHNIVAVGHADRIESWTTEAGRNLCTFFIAVTRRGRVLRLEVSTWDQLAVYCGDRLRRNQVVVVEGRFYTDPAGNPVLFGERDKAAYQMVANVVKIVS